MVAAETEDVRSPGALQSVDAPSLPFCLVDAAVVLALAAAVALSPWHYDNQCRRVFSAAARAIEDDVER